ncbi:cGMP-dependent protein kinase 2-like isoform X1 [Centrocercus urophasianus]|uniref:cGMP-dependent protein kinase 2-like isoform X1 n=1 Tax=Centrocercus urophasianus TaxID=9002 RepID=UPI001C647FC9|nr:cGMP-dependent protein kinase 2-like isoform X1 [Centrocercus urophasianus]
MLCHEGHDFAVDFWMLGILVFEMLVGRCILDGIFSFPAFLREAACSLIAKLCRWFSAIRWKRLALQQMEAPAIQLLKEGPPMPTSSSSRLIRHQWRMSFWDGMSSSDGNRIVVGPALEGQ